MRSFSVGEPTNRSSTAPLYTQLPYPGDGVVRTTSARILREGMRRLAPALLSKADLRIADVGCGTGEATAGLARIFPNARIVGIDVNPASLELARRLADRSKLNLTFVRCDISEPVLDALCAASVLGRNAASNPAERFDVVTSMGVLHHLADPAAGFSHVRSIIREDGLFQVYVYSRTGRREVLAVRDLLDRFLPADAFDRRARTVRVLRLSRKHTLIDGLQTLRRRLRFGPPFRLMEIIRVALRRNRLTHVSDTFSNPCEHSFLFEELLAIFARTGWDFAGLAKRGGLPVTPEEHTRDPQALEALRALPPAVLCDLLAFHYRAAGWTFFLRPAEVVGDATESASRLARC
ncbi:MAG: class I SAM-dependent methyltransferase [Phycisphaerales bacterium]|nr:class I SAM-dependent methyltransferase [Phycisphaerales bacterium]